MCEGQAKKDLEIWSCREMTRAINLDKTRDDTANEREWRDGNSRGT